MIPWICVGVLLAMCPLWWWWGRRQRDQDLEQLKRGAMGILTDQLGALQQQIEAARLEAQTERDKSSRYFAKCQDFEKERDEFQHLYTTQSIGHGNAQNLMMQTIERLAQQLQQKGVRAQIPKVLHVVREEFREHHEIPALALTQAAKAQAPLSESAPAAEPAPVAAVAD